MADCTALFHSFFLSTELFSILKALCAKSIEVARQACALPCATPSYASGQVWTLLPKVGGTQSSGLSQWPSNTALRIASCYGSGTIIRQFYIVFLSLSKCRCGTILVLRLGRRGGGHMYTCPWVQRQVNCKEQIQSLLENYRVDTLIPSSVYRT